MELGVKLRRLREDAGMTRYELADKIGVTYSAIAKYETNIRVPEHESLVKYADLFNVPVDYLLGRTVEVKAPLNVNIIGEEHVPKRENKNPLEQLPEGWTDEVMQLVSDPFGVRVRKMREARNWSIEKLATESGVSDELIALLETSSSSHATVKPETVKKLAAAFKISSAALTTNRVVDLTPVLSHLPEDVRAKVMDPSYAPFVRVAVGIKDEGITPEVLNRMVEMMRIMYKEKND